jgi:hypothetical protein
MACARTLWSTTDGDKHSIFIRSRASSSLLGRGYLTFADDLSLWKFKTCFQKVLLRRAGRKEAGIGFEGSKVGNV